MAKIQFEKSSQPTLQLKSSRKSSSTATVNTQPSTTNASQQSAAINDEINVVQSIKQQQIQQSKKNRTGRTAIPKSKSPLSFFSAFRAATSTPSPSTSKTSSSSSALSSSSSAPSASPSKSSESSSSSSSSFSSSPSSSSSSPTSSHPVKTENSKLNQHPPQSTINNTPVTSSSGISIKSNSKRFSLLSCNRQERELTASTTSTTSSITTSKQTITPKGHNVWSSSNKKIISHPLPPYETEVTEVDGVYYVECPLCVLLVSYETMPNLISCGHRACTDCMQRYLKTEINHSRLNITCPICSEPLLQNVIRDILNDDKFYHKYESFMLRKVLAAEPDARWCPAPDCGYAVLANGCASCPRLVCERDGCNTAFCYHCKQEWHPDQTCKAANYQRNKRAGIILDASHISDLIGESAQPGGNNSGRDSSSNRKSSKTSQQNTTLRPEDIKECPVCSSRIIKMNDGSCNHMTCSICETEFCWLCMKEISDFHYFSPSGCTFWGKKPWSRKKKFLWRLGMLVGAPFCIVFIAGISVPAIVIGIPFWAARKLHARLEKKQFSRYRKNAILTGGVLLSFLVSPFITAVALAVGVPLLLGYVYGVVPLSLCRSTGGCLSASPSVENLHEQFTQAAAVARRLNAQATDVDTAVSHKLGNPSIGETSMYMSNISLETNSIGHLTNVERGEDRESASNAALAGSIFSQTADDGNSTRALAGSIISKDSGGYTLIPVEIHSRNQSPAATITTSSHRVQKEQSSERSIAATVVESDLALT